MLRITAQLVNVEEDSNFWSETWDRQLENLFEIQDEISLLIADKLREHLGHLNVSEHLIETHTNNLKAYQHLLKARFHFKKWNAEDVQTAINEFDQTVSLDPNLIDGHLGLADTYSFMAVAGYAPREDAWKKALESIEIARRIDPENAGLNYMLGNQAFFTNADFTGAMKYGMRALESVPTYSEAHQFLSFLYSLRGDFKKAKEHIFYAKSIDPLNPEALFF
jgi:tetratricopeptide (TPR) repeat protein